MRLANSMRRRAIALLLLPLVTLSLTAFLLHSVVRGQADLSKRPLEHADYDAWKTLGSTSISPDGQWVMYVTQNGAIDGETTLSIRQTATAKEYRIQRGSEGEFSYDSHFAFFYVALPKKKSTDKPKDQPQQKLQILELASGNLVTIERVKSFSRPKKDGLWAAWLLSPDGRNQLPSQKSRVGETYEIMPTGLRRPQKQFTLKKREPNHKLPQPKQQEAAHANFTEEQESSVSKENDKSKDDDKKKKKVGTTLVLQNLRLGTQLTFPYVTSFRFSKHGNSLAFVTSAKSESNARNKETKQAEGTHLQGQKTDSSAAYDSDRPQDGVTFVDLNTLKVTQIATGLGQYKKLTFNEEGSQLAFITDRDHYKAKTPTWSLYHWKRGTKKAARAATTDDEGLPDGWWVSPQANLQFSENGKRLYFETSPIPANILEERADQSSEKDANKAGESEEKKAKLDIWHWQDPQLQPQQLLQATAERKRDYRAAYFIASRKLVQLADQGLPKLRIDVRSHSNLAIGNSNLRYQKLLSWDVPGFQDAYLVNLDTGHRQLVLERVKFHASLSPAGKFITWFDAEQKQWFSKSTTDVAAEPIEISAGIEFPLQHEVHDIPNLANAYGAAGWLAEDRALLVYDRYDIWQLDPTGKQAPMNVTQGWGRQHDTQLRYVHLDPEERSMGTNQPWVLRAFNQRTKASGYYLLQPQSMSEKGAVHGKDHASRSLQQLIMLDEDVNSLQKAELSEDLIFVRHSFRHCKDLWATNIDFEKLNRISDINPQQEDFSWGTAELVHWRATEGQRLDGILYKPEGFDPQKKYPLIVNFYERESDDLHKYFTPAPQRSSICHSFYVSRGYLVFVPDISYQTGKPGLSATNAILPGVQSLIDQGFVDMDRIGMQGHSWGGYQVAYLVTQTDMFACAESGAPVSNMTSAYGGIRWSTGKSRMFQYERTQSRIGANLWSARKQYIANSPLFFADRINTPLLILHNDQDGAVPWYQGIELFVALRRLEKPAWMLNYNGNPHWVMGDVNRRDFAIRLQQFFDHYLKNAPEPQWMAVGVPAVDKGQQLGLELLEPKQAARQEKLPNEQGAPAADKSLKARAENGL